MIHWSTRYTTHFIKWMNGVPHVLLLVPDRDSKPSNTVSFIMQSFFAYLDQDAQVGGFSPSLGHLRGLSPVPIPCLGSAPGTVAAVSYSGAHGSAFLSQGLLSCGPSSAVIFLELFAALSSSLH